VDQATGEVVDSVVWCEFLGDVDLELQGLLAEGEV
jgi:hypothetical protein